ncbi:MAG: hypothetical protein GY794_24810 [bacterium]|nr:hypothetical protein [bacterium]
MENIARLYNCVRCHHQVTICSHCDRGNIYCGKSCADSARRTSLGAAGRRYQNTHRGRLKHAERQRRYRTKHKKVTHQGSPEAPSNDPLSTRSEAPSSVADVEDIEGVEGVKGVGDEAIRCHFCGRLCSDYLRLDYLHRTTPPLASDRKIIHWPSKLRAQAP